MLRSTSVLLILATTLVLVGSSGLVSAQFGSTMDITENDSSSVPYDSGDEVKLNLELEMQNVERYSTKIEYNKNYLAFEQINGDHDVWWDQGSGNTIYVGGRAANSTGGEIDNATSTLQLSVKEDLPKDGVVNTTIDVVEPQATVSGDIVTDILGQETTINVDTGEREKQFDVDLEMDGSLQVTKGESRTIRSYATNRGGEFTDLRLELLVDRNRDGVITENEVVSEKDVTLQEQQKVFESEYENIELSEGDYDFYTRLVRDGEVQRSFTNSTLTVLQKNQSISVGLGNYSVDGGESVKVPVEVEGGDVAGYEMGIEYDNEILEFVSASGAEFDDPVVNSQSGYIKLTQSMVTTYDDPTVAELEFTGLKEGNSVLDIVESDTTFNSISNADIESDYKNGNILVLSTIEDEFDVGIEMESGIQTDRGDSEVIESYATNEDGGTIEDLKLELLVDTDQNNQFGPDEVVSSKDVELTGVEDSFEIEYDDINLSEGKYEFYTRLVKGDQVQRSYTNSTLTVNEEIDVREVGVNIPDRAADVNETVTVPLEVEEGNISEYVATIEYNSDIIEFISVDGGEFDRPEVSVQSGYVTISSSMDRDYVSPEVAQLEFRTLTEGTSDVEIVESETRFSSLFGSETETDYRDGKIEVLPNENQNNQTYLDVNVTVVDNRNGTVKFSSVIESSADIETVNWDPKSRDSGNEAINQYNGFGTSEFVHNYSESGAYVAEVEVTTVNGEKDSDEVVVRTNVTDGDEGVKIVETDIETQRDELVFGENITVGVGADVEVEDYGLNLSLGYENTYMEFAGIEESSVGKNLNVSLNRGEELTYVNLRHDESVDLDTDQVAQVRFETSDPNPELRLDSVTTLSIEEQVLDRSEDIKTTGDKERILISDKEQETEEDIEDSDEDDNINKTDDDQGLNETLDETDENTDINETLDETDENTDINETLDETDDGTDNNRNDEQQSDQSIINSIVSIIGFGENGDPNDSVDQGVEGDQNNLTDINQTKTDQGNEDQSNGTGTSDSGEDQDILDIFAGLFG